MGAVFAFPTLFFAAIRTVKSFEGLTQQNLDQLQNAHRIVAAYDDCIWSSSLILIPACYHDRWMLFVVCNARLAQPKNNVAPPCQHIEAGDRRPDQRKLCILSLNARGETPEKLRRIIGLYLEYHYLSQRGEELEYVDDWEATVRLLRADYSIPLTPPIVPVSGGQSRWRLASSSSSRGPDDERRRRCPSQGRTGSSLCLRSAFQAIHILFSASSTTQKKGNRGHLRSVPSEHGAVWRQQAQGCASGARHVPPAQFGPFRSIGTRVVSDFSK